MIKDTGREDYKEKRECFQILCILNNITSVIYHVKRIQHQTSTSKNLIPDGSLRFGKGVVVLPLPQNMLIANGFKTVTVISIMSEYHSDAVLNDHHLLLIG